ncbi:MAG: transposase [Armatimonadaceae bacterium]|jgi:transposase
MKPDRRSYDAAYKAEAVRLAVERNNVTSVARDLGIGSTTLQRWVDLATEHPDNPFPGNGNARDAEMQRLLRENRRLREDNEILKKAVGIFTNAQK